MKVTAIITAHNEERTVIPLLECLLRARPAGQPIQRLRVVSSASTDRTDALVAELMQREARVELIVEPQRRGKCAAINTALAGREPADVVLLSSADVLPEPGAIEALIAAFEDPRVGMAGGRPVPSNDPASFFGFAAHLLWNVHHHVALVNPKLGEVVAFRDEVESIPEQLAVDEAALESILVGRGYRLAYVPEARILNRGAENLREFLSQRRRISAGHYHLKRQRGYEVATAGYSSSARGLLKELRPHPRALCFAFSTAVLCVLGRWLGAWDFYIARRTHTVWDIAESTKRDVVPRPVTSSSDTTAS